MSVSPSATVMKRWFSAKRSILEIIRSPWLLLLQEHDAVGNDGVAGADSAGDGDAIAVADSELDGHGFELAGRFLTIDNGLALTLSQCGEGHHGEPLQGLYVTYAPEHFR